MRLLIIHTEYLHRVRDDVLVAQIIAARIPASVVVVRLAEVVEKFVNLLLSRPISVSLLLDTVLIVRRLDSLWLEHPRISRTQRHRCVLESSRLKAVVQPVSRMVTSERNITIRYASSEAGKFSVDPHFYGR